MPPVHAQEVNGTLLRMSCQLGHAPVQESSELSLVYLSGRHGKFLVFDGAVPTNMTVYGHVIRWIGKRNLCQRTVQQRGVGTLLESRGAKQAVLAEKPEITDSFPEVKFRRNLKLRLNGLILTDVDFIAIDETDGTVLFFQLKCQGSLSRRLP